MTPELTVLEFFLRQTISNRIQPHNNFKMTLLHQNLIIQSSRPNGTKSWNLHLSHIRLLPVFLYSTCQPPTHSPPQLCIYLPASCSGTIIRSIIQFRSPMETSWDFAVTCLSGGLNRTFFSNLHVAVLAKWDFKSGCILCWSGCNVICIPTLLNIDVFRALIIFWRDSGLVVLITQGVRNLQSIFFLYNYK